MYRLQGINLIKRWLRWFNSLVNNSEEIIIKNLHFHFPQQALQKPVQKLPMLFCCCFVPMMMSNRSPICFLMSPSLIGVGLRLDFFMLVTQNKAPAPQADSVNHRLDFRNSFLSIFLGMHEIMLLDQSSNDTKSLYLLSPYKIVHLK